MSGSPYHPAWWIPGAHLRTIWGTVARPGPRVPLREERWETADGDFIDLHRLDPPAEQPAAPRVLILHGLEGSPRSHYARGMVDQARRRGWGADVLVFRSCGNELNRLPRFYHSGDTGDLDLVVRRIVAGEPNRPLAIAGVSLGGNVLLKWLGERSADLPAPLWAAATVSVPYDLARCARRIDRGFSRVYQARFLRTLRAKTRQKQAQFPECYHRQAIDAARSLYEFDDTVTAPAHGFRDAEDYYEQSSSIRWVGRIRLPTLLLSAIDDPFLPPDVLDEVRRLAAPNPWLTLEFVARGGHAGFIGGGLPWRPDYYAERRVLEFFAGHPARVVVHDASA